jgi:hypothetical protein
VTGSGHDLSIEELRARLGPIVASEPAVAAAYVFGSVARGEAGPESDLDVAILYRRGEPQEVHARVAAELAASMARAAGIEAVDIIDLEAQGSIFAHRVLCEGRRIYEGDPARRVDFESDTIVRALDFRPTYDLATRDKPAALRRWLRKRYDLRADPVQARPPQGEPRETR